ncbi:hypothetical protein LY78DRAFT_102862 [Colletotrichum sublineola]|nr:hypothetical protein LY78DRAFT_102862 [Colletotrichum sublineola]
MLLRTETECRTDAGTWLRPSSGNCRASPATSDALCPQPSRNEVSCGGRALLWAYGAVKHASRQECLGQGSAKTLIRLSRPYVGSLVLASGLCASTVHSGTSLSEWPVPPWSQQRCLLQHIGRTAGVSTRSRGRDWPEKPGTRQACDRNGENTAALTLRLPDALRV